jgi:serine palmitoyltransferase
LLFFFYSLLSRTLFLRQSIDVLHTTVFRSVTLFHVHCLPLLTFSFRVSACPLTPVQTACRATIEKYGVGSCGPRGFYGTFDLHLEIEAALAKFMAAEECILYSDAIACVSSVIPAFAKKGDTIVVDDATNFGIQTGCLLSRSTIHYFKHGDMSDLEKVLETLHKKELAGGSKHKQAHRKFIVVEGVSSVYGDILPLERVLELKDKYSYRLILDDSLGFGVLGATGKGTMEHFDCAMQSEAGEPGVDILCASMDNALASVGGFCVGNHQVVDHQRLSGAGYCFSASSPPYTSTASLLTLGMIAAQPALGASLRKKASKLRRSLGAAHRNLVVLGSSSFTSRSRTPTRPRRPRSERRSNASTTSSPTRASSPPCRSSYRRTGTRPRRH